MPTTSVQLQITAEGISGLDRGPSGQLWIVPERQREVIPIQNDGSAGPALPIRGIPEGVDTESIAWLEGGRLALGLEAPRAGTVKVGGVRCDVGILAREADGPLRLTECLSLPLRFWRLKARPNQGVEGICRAGGQLLATLETVLQLGGKRYTPLALYDLQHKTWRGFSLGLSSDADQKGKVSALHCRQAEDGALHVYAVERHFKVRRLLYFKVPPGGGTEEAKALRPQRMVNLQASKLGGPNPEGLCRLDSERWAIVNDNHYGRRQGDTFLSVLRITPPLP